jgi:hypothetical protein
MYMRAEKRISEGKEDLRISEKCEVFLISPFVLISLNFPTPLLEYVQTKQLFVDNH